MTYSTGLENVLAQYDGLGNFIGVQTPTVRGDQCDAYVPLVSGIETSQHFMDRVAVRHCLPSGFNWINQCGSYVPNKATPFQLAGYPTNDKNFWAMYKANIIRLGSGIADDFSYRPWNNKAGNTSWSGDSYNPTYINGNYEVSGRHPLVSGEFLYGPILKDDYNTFVVNGANGHPLFFPAFSFTVDRKVTTSGYLGHQLYDSNIFTSETNSTKPDPFGAPGYTIYPSGVSGSYPYFSVKISGIRGLNRMYISDGVSCSETFGPSGIWSTGIFSAVTEVEHYRATGVFDVFPLYELAYNLNGVNDTTIAASAFPDVQYLVNDAMVGYAPFSLSSYQNIFTYGSTLGNGEGVAVSRRIPQIDYLTVSFNSGVCNVSGADPSSGYSRTNVDTFYCTVGRKNSSYVWIYPLFKGDLKTDFRKISGMITDGRVYFNGDIQDGELSLGSFFRGPESLFEYNNTIAGERTSQPEDIITNTEMKIMGGGYTDVSGLYDAIFSDGTKYEVGRFDYWTSRVFSSSIINDSAQVGFDAEDAYSYNTPTSGYQYNNSGIFSIDTSLLGCNSSGAKFLAFWFEPDFQAMEPEIRGKTVVNIDTESHRRFRTYYTGVKVDGVSWGVVPILGAAPVYSGFINPQPFTTARSNWIYNQVSVGASSTTTFPQLNFGGLPGASGIYVLTGLGNQTRAKVPFIEQPGFNFIEPVSGNFLGCPIFGDLQIDYPERLYSGDPITNYFTI
jgi:hypothetical protein